MVAGAHSRHVDSNQLDKLSRATEWVMKCQQARDAHEEVYARALRGYQDAQAAVERLRSQIGDNAIKRTVPFFRQAQQHLQVLAAERGRISASTERARSAKLAYNRSIQELERISNAVHAARKSHDVGDAAKDLPEVTLEIAPEVTGHEPDSTLEGLCGDLGVAGAAYTVAKLPLEPPSPSARPAAPLLRVSAMSPEEDDNGGPFS